MDLNPKISIITVVRNGEQYIEHTISSIISQTYANIEYIIIDGKSTDNTTDIIKKFSGHLAYWVSEPDKGIYDAMNKGVAAATGDWIIFINADDFLISETAISEAVPYLAKTNALIVYGQVRVVYPIGDEMIVGSEWEKSKFRFRNVAMCFPHQATFHSKTLFEDESFDISFKIAGDYDFLLRHLRDHDAEFVPVLIAKMRAGGISHSASKIALLKDTRKAQIKNKIYKSIPPLAWHISAIKLILTNTLIRVVGINGKDRLKKLVGKN
ncbi:glycosyltransferase family 2 protein [Dyadobacter sp. CY323]|uniref:glycosyltransferase family 2 protein n=1 Tax=Dyadobacter sp. CY323 TaxID=2907302 RepID=UPI001F2EA8E3|nr:glycosyltransferase family 2 protein [Dyadobacter sp. CY323]MCE6990961.1 glycosyltransferase [Dyadobacter sp. CY323]